AHGIWFNDEELKLLKETDTGVSHCPTSNMRLGSGIARIREMVDMGIRVGLGVDGSASNDTSDMLGEVRNAMLSQRVKYGSAGLTAREALYLATRGGAELLHLEKLGYIEEGMGADLALFNLNTLQYAGSLSDPLAALVFTGYNHEADYTIVNGKMVVRKGKLVDIDEEELTWKVNTISKKILESS
ncbi:MAG TPA: 8-oxoguanine deaminase, partial [candidate division WOR-3 bacterium]|nr:8-oxoguanine deaminase [candidate division WOR-3 bacterium]